MSHKSNQTNFQDDDWKEDQPEDSQDPKSNDFNDGPPPQHHLHKDNDPIAPTGGPPPDEYEPNPDDYSEQPVGDR